MVGGDYVEHRSASGRVTGTSSARAMDLKPKAQSASVSVAAAKLAAVSDAAASGATVAASRTDRVWYNGEDGLVPAYDVLIEGVAADRTPVRTHVYVDGLSGAVVDASAEIVTGSGTGFLTGSVTLGNHSRQRRLRAAARPRPRHLRPQGRHHRHGHPHDGRRRRLG